MAGRIDRGKIVVLHDSFVNTWLDDFKAILPGQYLHVNTRPSSETVAAAMAEADTVMTVFVERNVLRYPEWDTLAWKSSVGNGNPRKEPEGRRILPDGP